MFFASIHAQHFFYITKNGKLFGYGKNSCGCLGLGSQKEFIVTPTELNFFSKRNSKLINIHLGGNFSIFQSKNSLYIAGKVTNEKEESRKRNTKSPKKLFEDLEIPGKITFVSAGYRFFHFITSLGGVYSFGKNKSGQLGTGDFQNVLSVPKIIALERAIQKSIFDIKSGSKHTLFITKEREIFACGDVNCCRMDHHNYKPRSVPMKILNLDHPIFKNIKEVELHAKDFLKIECGAEHTAILDENNGITILGSNKYMQNPIQNDKQMRRNFCDYHNLYCSSNHNVFTKGKNIYVFGRGKAGRLGTGNEKNCSEPTKLPEITILHKEIICGPSQTFIISKNSIKGCGWGKFGQFGNGDINNLLKVQTLQKIELKKFV